MLYYIIAVTPKDIKTLYKRFIRLDRFKRGTISVEDISMIPEVTMNPLAPRLLQMFERDSEERINFRSFVKALSFFNPRARSEDRIECKYIDV